MTRFFKLLAGLFAAATLMVSSANAAANQIDVTATVGAVLVAGFSDVSGENGDGVFTDDALNQIDLGTVAPGATHNTVTQPIFLKTNNAAGAELTLEDAVNGGNLAGPGANIPVSYTFDGTAITFGTAFDLSTVATPGNISMGDFVVAPGATAGDQTPGSYSTSITVTLAAK